MTAEEITKRLHDNPQETVEELFRSNYNQLYRLAYRFTRDGKLAEDIVQDVFIKLLEKAKKVIIQTSIQAYLKRSTINASLDYLRKNKLSISYDQNIAESKEIRKTSNATFENIYADDLKKKIHNAISTLPPKRKAIFILSRKEKMSYKEIAEFLDISVKTVEAQMSSALTHIRKIIYKRE